MHLINKSLEQLVLQNVGAGRLCERVHLYSVGQTWGDCIGKVIDYDYNYLDLYDYNYDYDYF